MKGTRAMQRYAGILIAVLAPVLFAVGWWCRSLTDSTAEIVRSGEKQVQQDGDATSAGNKDRCVELESELREARDVIAQQQRVMSESELIQGRLQAIEDMFVLQPARFPVGNWSASETRFEDCWFVTADGVRLHGWYAGQAQPRAVILYLHGNAGNITHRAHVASLLQERLNASLLLFDYRGYGRSEGVPSIGGLELDARAARDYLAERERIAPDQIVLLGRSLGGAVAVELAASGGARALVLESTFASLREAAAAHYPKWAVGMVVTKRLDSAARIGQYQGPVLISHGDADRTIPFAQSRRLFAEANEPKWFVRIPNGDHNDPQSAEYYQQLERLVERTSVR